MLVLSRKEGERVVIGDGIEVTVLQICGHVVRLGFEADRSVEIRRAELRPLEGDSNDDEQKCA